MTVGDARLEKDGFELIEGLLGEKLRGELDEVSANQRGIFENHPRIAALASGALVKDTLQRVVGKPCFVVRGILFDKTARANWHVGWHQDQVIAVRRKLDVEGFTGWSVKARVPHVLAPTEVLEAMVSIRLHLDDSPAENGALRVLAGSHRHGLLAEESRANLTRACEEVVCEVAAGDALVMRPLLLHSSTAAEKPRQRRVIHLECATQELPGGLEWHWRL